MAYCKKCHSAWRIEHRQANQEAYLEKERAYYKRGVRQAYAKSHREQGKRSQRKYYLSHNEQQRQYARQRYRLNPEKVRLSNRRYIETHREKVQAYQWQYSHSKQAVQNRREWDYNNRARKKAIPGKHTLRQIREKLQRQHYRCYYCQKHFDKRNGKYIYQIEHTFPLSKANGIDPINDISYLVLACKSCNSKKRDKYPWEFFEGGRLL